MATVGKDMKTSEDRECAGKKSSEVRGVKREKCGAVSRSMKEQRKMV